MKKKPKAKLILICLCFPTKNTLTEQQILFTYIINIKLHLPNCPSAFNLKLSLLNCKLTLKR